MATALAVPWTRLLTVIFVQGTLATQLTVPTSFNATQADHPGEVDGFVLAMRFANPSQFTFHSAYWTNDELVDEFDADPDKNSDGKFDTFVSALATEIRGCLPGGCKTYTLDSPTILKDLFTSTPIGSTQNIKFGESNAETRLWAEYAGRNGWTEQTGWMDSGINYEDDVSTFQCRVRFGALFNNQLSINTANDAIGFGATEASGTQVGAGAATYSGNTYPVQGTIWIKVSPATTAHYALSGSWYGETTPWTYSTHGGFMGGASGDRTVYCMDNGVVDATAVDGSVHTMGTVCCQPDGVGTRPGCVSGTYETAAAHCESVGQALCTVEQIKAGSGEGSGCSFDDDLVWTSNGCTPTTASPTPTPPDAASATGDPHLSNIRGEHFDVYQPGNMALIHVPRRAEPARTLLLVEAEARRMGDECSVYFQGVTISGLWTNQSKPIQFLASSRGPPEGRKWKEWVRFGSIDLKVVRRTKGVDYLNVYIRNLGRTSYEVGGLLGLDDHSTVAKRPRQCAHRHAAMLESSVADAS